MSWESALIWKAQPARNDFPFSASNDELLPKGSSPNWKVLGSSEGPGALLARFRTLPRRFLDNLGGARKVLG